MQGSSKSYGPLHLRYLSLFASAAALMAGAAAHAENNDAIQTDRPDFVESSAVVGKGKMQLETSFAIERNRMEKHHERTSSTPTLLRIGTGDTWELRIETDGRTDFRSTDDTNGKIDTAHGYSDLSVGVKLHAQDGAGSKPSTAWLLHADIDSGSSAFRGHGIRPSLRWTAEWELPHAFSLGVMPGLTYDTTERGHRFVGGLFGIVLGKSWNERFRTFAEVAAPRIARAGNGGSIATFDVGGAYLLSDTCQVDTALSRGLNKNTADLSWTVGISFKL
jgi:outer membrane putative beta-barrel porin/alpha-amylase